MRDVYPATQMGSPPNPRPLRDRIGGQEPIRLGGHMPDPPDARDHLLEERDALARRGEFLKAQLDARDATIATLNAQLNELQDIHETLVTAYGREDLSEDTSTVIDAMAAEWRRWRKALVQVRDAMPIGRHASPDECAAMRETARAALAGPA